MFSENLVSEHRIGFSYLRSASPPTLNDFLVLALFDVSRPQRARGGLSANRKLSSGHPSASLG
jgi:hypothetical protein